MTTQAKARHITKLQAMFKCARLATELEAKGYNAEFSLNCHYSDGSANHSIYFNVYNWRATGFNKVVYDNIYLPVTHAEFDERIKKIINEVNRKLS